jgi:hypothetical protein
MRILLVPQDFLELASQWATLQSSAIVKLYGVMLYSPLAMVMEYLTLGPLDVYLREHKNNLKQVDLVQAGALLANALWHLVCSFPGQYSVNYCMLEIIIKRCKNTKCMFVMAIIHYKVGCKCFLPHSFHFIILAFICAVENTLLYNPRASRSGCLVKGVVLGHLVTGIVGSNPARSVDVCLCVSVLCCPV